ncbi:hypothetical protein [Escherichia coli]
MEGIWEGDLGWGVLKKNFPLKKKEGEAKKLFFLNQQIMCFFMMVGPRVV